MGAPWWQCLLLQSAPVILTARLVYQPIDTRWAAGAEGERRTAALLVPLRQDGWYVLHDRAIPATRANADHILVGAAGVFVIDSKHWSAKATVRVRGGRLWHGRADRTEQLRTATWETQQVARALGVAAATIVVVHGAEVPDGKITLDGVTVVGARRLQHLVRSLTPIPGYDTERVRQLAAAADRTFPPYTS
ncbi:nuclease-related domain-containing protein [Kitasatospora herbaricolor]|uniref:NERD domain-containing protein n=1 Tax=Kitasatospora herbaricolor TaxID=68217 RepID=A0ABZ1WK84_9ACTN|nr:nuclease-related domain-containing protein [Kitasatospora herbaricolor]